MFDSGQLTSRSISLPFVKKLLSINDATRDISPEKSGVLILAGRDWGKPQRGERYALR
jgi:hypothetical protein